MPGQGKHSAIVPLEPVKFDPRTAAIKYDPDFGWRIRELAQEGQFPESWCAALGVTMSTMYRWANIHEEFEEHFNIAWHILHHHWTDRAANLKAGPGEMPPTVMLEFLRKRFPKTWGKNPMNTHENFTHRNDPDAEATSAQITTQSSEEIAARIEKLQQRRAQDSKQKDAR